MFIKTCRNFKKLSLCFVHFHGRVRELLSFLEKSQKAFLKFDLQKKLCQHIENLLQHLSEKFIGDTLSITDYRYRFSTERFILPITAWLGGGGLVVCLLHP